VNYSDLKRYILSLKSIFKVVNHLFLVQKLPFLVGKTYVGIKFTPNIKTDAKN
jgi:hypothetical protein